MALQAISAAAVHPGSLATGGEGRGLTPGQSPVLRIIVENLFYPVTLEVLQQVCGFSVWRTEHLLTSNLYSYSSLTKPNKANDAFRAVELF